MKIRLMEEKDIEQVYEIETSTFSKPWSKKDFQQSVQNQEHIYLVAEEQECILGYCGMWCIAGEGQITNVAVAKEHRGKGIADKMFACFLEEGYLHNVQAFTLEVRVSNQVAISLYQKYGFENAGIRKKFYEEPTEDAMIMWKKNETMV